MHSNHSQIATPAAPANDDMLQHMNVQFRGMHEELSKVGQNMRQNFDRSLSPEKPAGFLPRQMHAARDPCSTYGYFSFEIFVEPIL